jgi:MYND finger/MORN repeat
MSYPMNIRKQEDGVIVMTIDSETGTDLYILPSGKIITIENGLGKGKLYNELEDYPHKIAYCGDINVQTYEPEGEGKFLYYNDHKLSYVGSVSAGERRGKGTLTYRNGLIEKGWFEGATFNGTQTHNCGTTIIGFWENDTLEEVTRVSFPDGRSITETKPHEGDARFFIGRLFYPNVGVFVGDIWKKGLEPYNGTMSFLDGRTYTGQCRNGGPSENRVHFNANGMGKMVLADGTSYDGKWTRGIVCDNFRGTLRLYGENAGSITGHPHVGVMAKYFSRDDFVGFATCAVDDEVEVEEAKVKVEVEVEDDAESSDSEDESEASPTRQLLLNMREQVRLRKAHLQELEDEDNAENEREARDERQLLLNMRERDRLHKICVQEEEWRRNALASEEGEEDVSDVSSEADEELVQRKQERTYTVAEDNVEENLKCVLATCGFCPKEFVKRDVYYLCSMCQRQAYCGDECQRRHWPQHKKTCKNMVEEDV